VSDLPTYTFLPWLRSGIANSVTSADHDAGAKVRATLPLDLVLSGKQLDGANDDEPLHRDISLYGPSDLIGIDPRAVVKAEPRNWITNFEPNYLPYIEFYDEDFPWRYTPAAADGAKHRLRPWIALVILKEGEFDEGKNMQGKPLPYFTLKGVNAADIFPLPDQLWGWAHVHVNLDLALAGDTAIPGVLQRLESNIAQNPDRAYSRIMCPRRLEADTQYHAFLIPTFETGRLAGLGLDVPDATVATASAWANNQVEFPYYFRWYFKAGAFGDFEYLVNLLKPRPADKRVGVREMDVLHPGSNLPPIGLPAELGGILRLGGALQVPFATLPLPDKQEVTRFDQWDVPFPHAFERAVAALVNLADDYNRQAADAANPDGDPDPVVTLPLYGRWHAPTERLLQLADGTPAPHLTRWVHRLNLDPRFRVAAGFGTGVIQENDDLYMNAAWQQVGDVISANNKIRQVQLACAAALRWHARFIEPLPAARAFVLTAPMHTRIMGSEITVATKVRQSILPAAALSPPFRRAIRPGSTLSRRLALTPAAVAEIASGINSGDLHPAPPKTKPAGAIDKGAAGTVITDQGVPSWLVDLLRKHPWLRFLPLFLLLLLFLVAILVGGALAIAILAVGVPALGALYYYANRWSKAVKLADSIADQPATPASVDELPTVDNFVLSRPGSGFTPHAGAADSAEATRFKAALKDSYRFTSVVFPEPERKALAIAELAGKVVAGINPALTIPRRLTQSIRLPGYILENLRETFVPVMHYPIIDTPMYKPLSDISPELLLPNLNLIPPNTITLLESNQRFIESYMVGVNHEMSRELLWRGYPTDQRGSCFCQFWDASMLLPAKPTPADREKVRDIPELHTWPRSSNLGAHNKRSTTGEATLVLVIRGELLKRYPTAVIYAQHSAWHRKGDGTPDVTAERELVELSEAEEDSLPADKIRLPLFEAKVEPDVYFIGFDLTAPEVKGGTTGAQDPGWFFVIKERPGEPRFGLDESTNGPPRLINWNNLDWSHIGTLGGEPIDLSQNLSFDPYNAGLDQENRPVAGDAQARWTPNTNAADLAYILYRVPVLVAVHGSRMLP